QMIAGASALLIARALLAPPPLSSSDGEAASLRFGLQAAALSGAIALATFVWSWMELPAELDPKAYYEMLFWGPGHVVQFTWTLLMLVGWLWLSGLVGAAVPLTPRMATVLFAIGLSGALIAPLIYLNWPVISVEHNRMFTWLMRFGGGLAILPLAMAITIGLLRAPATTGSQRPMRAALIVSMTLFAIGGAIGFTIKGSDVRIPAHYHGSIVGVTLALMGLAYAIAPRLSGRSLNWRLAEWQVYLYGAGQLLHIIGLVWSGGHGVQRKVAGSEQVLDTIGQAAGMGLMGLGGLIAVVGGVLFVVAMAGVLPPARFATAAGTARGARTGPASLPEQRR
ncbi:MAG TPA: cytochrome C oxidase subunit I, partial [Burkholderiaceae bacterium]|nr:cytochrome C oxidase subunit I [Burkholderiaceae bacterium]